MCANATGTDDQGFYTFWHDTGTGCMTLGSGGAYSVTWDLGAQGNLVAGRGWETGAEDRTIHYTARTFEPGANGYLGLYGWSTDPLVEYYVVDSWGDFEPPGNAGEFLGAFESDGGSYRVYRTQRINQPSIQGTATFYQYWSVRTSKLTTGARATITFQNHVDAWRRAGLELGALNYQVLATEGFGSVGRSDVVVTVR
ncbi:MAG: 1,4-beta-xylanase [Brevundimonas sp.]|nr:MAG: 1,4-beta-xylanase [Brevundimonas sp.]